ncbi:MAG TPA: heavy-metal-associated domain-containing protein, partial [bacterium]|nr:heavy-metal-associated domain-containing protein [bacterium]
RMVRVLVQQASPLQDVPFIMRFAQELRGLDGVSVVRIEIARSEVLVTCDPARLAPEDLPGKLTERGYRAAQVPAGDEIE